LTLEVLESRTLLDGCFQAVLTTEHIDLVFDYINSAWNLGVSDDDRGIAYAPDEALIFGGPQARVTRPAGSQWDFLGVPAGQDVWIWPQVQDPALPYLGTSAELTPPTLAPWDPMDPRLPPLELPWIQVRLLAVRGPGQFSVWQTDSFGTPTVFMSTADGGITSSDVLYVPEGGHVHYNWGFSTAGFHEVDVQTLAYLGPGQTDPTGSAVTTFFFSVDPVLHVTRVTQRPGGVTVGFSRPIDRNPLNLYDTQTGTLGPADLTLVGNLVGAVQGSLVVNPVGTCVTFLRTGGVLEPDTYMLTLRSATNGFKDLTGQLLDGNNDGIRGDDHVSTVTVSSSSAVVVSLPDFARGPGQAVNVPANGTGLPLRLSNGSDVTAVNLTVHFDPNLLSLTAASVGPGVPAGASVTLNTSTPGRAVISFSSPTALSAGAIDLVRLTAQVPNGAGLLYTSKHVLAIRSLSVNGGALASQADDGLHAVGYFGDASGNAGNSATDAQRGSRVAQGLDGGFAAYQATDPRLLADINGDGILSAADASLVLQEAVGMDAVQIPPLPGTMPPITVIGPDPLVNIPTNLSGAQGTTVTAPVNIDLSDGLDSLELVLSYDTSRLEVLAAGDIQRGSITNDFDLFQVNLDNTAGTIRVALGRTAGPISGRGSGSLLTIGFRIKPAAPPGGTIINLRQDLAPTTTQLNEGGLVLNPAPSNTAGDALDGLITITPGGMNHPPVLQPISDLMIPSTQQVVTVALMGSDPDGDPLTYSATATSLAFVRDQQYNFFTTGDFFQNFLGLNEKWVQSAVLSNGWAYLLPNGELYEWDGATSGTLRGNVGQYYWDDPNRLIDVPTTPHATISVNPMTGALTVTRMPTTTISAIVVTATVSDGMLSASQMFTITVLASSNLPPTLAPIADQTIPSSQASVLVALMGSDPNGDPLTYSATATSLAYVRDQQYNFFTTGDFFQNFLGLDEKWVQSAAMSNGWAYILPNGELYEWNGMTSGTLRGNVGQYYWDDPNRLIDVPTTSHATLNVVGNQLTVTRTPTSTISAIVVTATVSDGMLSASQMFTITVTSS
jgi:hypothetical protein